jgi:hypothetical protein
MPGIREIGRQASGNMRGKVYLWESVSNRHSRSLAHPVRMGGKFGSTTSIFLSETPF